MLLLKKIKFQKQVLNYYIFIQNHIHQKLAVIVVLLYAKINNPALSVIGNIKLNLPSF